jgi:hypothetical protein
MPAHLHRTIQDKITGRVVLGATVTLCTPGTETAISDPIFSDFALTTPLPNPYVCSDGLIDVYLADRVDIQLKVQYGAAVDLADNLQVLPMATSLVVAPGELNILNTPGTGDALVGVDAVSAQFEPLSDVLAAIGPTVLGWFLSQTFQYATITRDVNGAMTAADVLWPDGLPGVYTADVISSIFPGKVDGWHVTRIDGVTTTTYTQPTVTRDDNGDITVIPVVVVT